METSPHCTGFSPCIPNRGNPRSLLWKSTKFASKPVPLHPEKMSLYIFNISFNNGSKPPLTEKM